MLEKLMKEVNIPHLTGQLLPEFRWRVAVLAQATGQRLFISDMELVQKQGRLIVGVGEMDRETWLGTLGQKVADNMAKLGVYDQVGDLVHDQFGDGYYDLALSLRKESGTSQNWWLLRFSDNTTAWVVTLPSGYRLPSDTELAEVRKTIANLTNAKERLVESQSIAV